MDNSSSALLSLLHSFISIGSNYINPTATRNKYLNIVYRLLPPIDMKIYYIFLAKSV